MPPASEGRPARSEPTRAWIVANVVLMQAGWFACVLGAAHGRPWLGTLVAAGVVAWHLWRAPRGWREARLVGAALGLGMGFDALMLAAGVVVYPNGQWAAWFPPHWMLALWALFATALNVSMRWMRRRAWQLAVLGAVAGPMAYLAGVRLGAASFVDPTLALALLAAGWAGAMPALVALAERFDGVGTADHRELRHG